MVGTEHSNEITGLLASPKVFAPSHDWHAKIRIQRFNFVNVSMADGDDAVLCQLPKGAIRVLIDQSPIFFGQGVAGGAGLRMDIGWAAYTASDGVAVVGDPNGMLVAEDIATAGSVVTIAGWGGAGMSVDGTIEFRSKEGVTINANLNTATPAVGTDITGYLSYTCE